MGTTIGLSIFVILVLSIILIPQLMGKFEKCNKCKNRTNNQYIHGEYGCCWYECRCNNK